MVGINIKKFRTRLGYSKSYLAKRLSVSPIVVSMWELGISSPNERNLNELSELLCTPIEELKKVDANQVESNRINRNLFVINVLVALFCMTAFIILWRFAPSIIPMHWTGGKIDRYGKKAELLISLIAISVFFITDLITYFPIKAEGSKIAAYVCHCLIIFFQLGFTAMMIGTYVKYVQYVLPFIICICASFAACTSAAIHPKIIKRKPNSTVLVDKYKIFTIVSCVAAMVSLIVFILSIIPIAPLK